MIELKYLLILLFVLTFSCQSDSKQRDQNKEGDDFDGTNGSEYKNPVFLPVFADPTIVKSDDGYFYGYATENEWVKGEVHVVPVIKSKNLVDWEYVSDAFETKPSWKNAGNIWAPDVTKVDGKYMMYYSFSTWGDENPGIGMAVSDNPEGPFTDLGKLFQSKEIGVANSIDPFYVESEGEKYLFWGSFHGIFGVLLSEDGKSVIGDKFQVAGDFMEATYIFPKDGYFYLFGSIGSCCEGANSTYKVVVGRSEVIQGPYLGQSGKGFLDEPGNVLLHGNTTGGYVGTGHNAEIITDDEGTDWLLYHAIDRENPKLPGGASKRPMLLDKITWENGWPVILNGQPSTGFQKAPVFK